MSKKLFVLSFSIMCMALIGHAHNPQLATFYIRNYDAIWMVEGSFPQVGLQTAMNKYYSKLDLTRLSDDDYKKHLVNYVKSHIEIKSEDGQQIRLGEGGLKLGGHQTDVRFILESLPATVQNLNITITCLSENDHHQNILKVPSLKSGKHYILNKESEFTTLLAFDRSDKRFMASWLSSEVFEGILIMTFLLTLSILLFSIRRIKKSTKLLYKEV